MLDLAARTLLVAGDEKRLTGMKYELLRYFLGNRGSVVSANEFIERGLLQSAQAVRYRGIVLELRRLLGPARDLLTAVPGHGYRLDACPEPRDDPMKRL